MRPAPAFAGFFTEARTRMTIKVGDRLPEATFQITTADGIKPRTSAEIFPRKKVVLFGVPGAFTPTCSRNHLPGFINNADAFFAKGVDTIAVTAVNDVFVMAAWAKANPGKIDFLSDGNGAFVQAMGLHYDATERLMGPVRSRRYALYAEDGVVKVLNVEEVTSKAEVSSADALLKMI
jgi:peroxiredoxin